MFVQQWFNNDDMLRQYSRRIMRKCNDRHNFYGGKIKLSFNLIYEWNFLCNGALEQNGVSCEFFVFATVREYSMGELNQRGSPVLQYNGDTSYVIGSQRLQFNAVGCSVFDKPYSCLLSPDIEDPWQISMSCLVQSTSTVAVIAIWYKFAYMTFVKKFVVNGTLPVVSLTHWCQVTHVCDDKLSHQ